MSTPAIITILIVLTVLSLGVICWSVRMVWHEMRGCGEGTESETRRNDLRNKKRVEKQVERWRNGQ